MATSSGERAGHDRPRVAHYECDDCWYSCPMSSEGCCNDNEPLRCNCGADRVNAHIETVENVALMALADLSWAAGFIEEMGTTVPQGMTTTIARLLDVFGPSATREVRDPETSRVGPERSTT